MIPIKKKLPKSDFETIIPLLIGVWRRFHKEAGPGDLLQTREFRRVVEHVQKLISGLGSKGALLGQNYFQDRETLGAYLLYQWPIHYLQGLSLINEIPASPCRVLDVCSGPTPFAFAASMHGAQEVICLDRNQEALNLGAQVCGRYGFPLTIKYWDYHKDPEIRKAKIEGKFDLIILAHCLEELFPKNRSGWREQQQKFLNRLLELLTPEGYLLLVEGSSNEENKRIIQIRDELVERNVPVQAPCVWKGACPIGSLENSPCYAQREFEKPYLVKEIQRAAKINLNSLKMSYIIFRSPAASWTDTEGRQLYRIISPPVESPMGKKYYICGVDGKKKLGSRAQAFNKENKAFEYLRRGELISIEGALTQAQTIDILDDTKIKIEAACGKPFFDKSAIIESEQ